MRHHQLQSRLATLKIENEEVRVHTSLSGLKATAGVLGCLMKRWNTALLEEII